jgi:hypothetical protein
VTRTEEFEELRPLLFAIAYRILGSVGEAEDAVQETWLRYETSPTPPTSTKAFLSAVVTRISIDVLRSARVRREEYVGPWFPEPLLTDPYEDPARSAELADSVSMAALLPLERLSPRSANREHVVAWPEQRDGVHVGRERERALLLCAPRALDRGVRRLVRALRAEEVPDEAVRADAAAAAALVVERGVRSSIVASPRWRAASTLTPWW